MPPAAASAAAPSAAITTTAMNHSMIRWCHELQPEGVGLADDAPTELRRERDYSGRSATVRFGWFDSTIDTASSTSSVICSI